MPVILEAGSLRGRRVGRRGFPRGGGAGIANALVRTLANPQEAAGADVFKDSCDVEGGDGSGGADASGVVGVDVSGFEGFGGSGRSYLVGLIGSGIGPSLSPALHEREADRQGLRYVYRLIDIDVLGVGPEAVGELGRAARDLGFDGLNITHPCKQLVVEHLDGLAPQVEALGAVNTVVFEADGSAIGHNTDVTGFAASFARGLPDAPMERVVPGPRHPLRPGRGRRVPALLHADRRPGLLRTGLARGGLPGLRRPARAGAPGRPAHREASHWRLTVLVTPVTTVVARIQPVMIRP